MTWLKIGVETITKVMYIQNMDGIAKTITASSSKWKTFNIQFWKIPLMEFIPICSNISYKDDMKNADQHQKVFLQQFPGNMTWEILIVERWEILLNNEEFSPQQHFMPLGLLRTSYLLLPLNIESSYPALPPDNFTNTLSFLTFLFEVGKWLIYQSWGSWPHDFCPMTNKQKFVIWSSSVDYLFGS